MKRPSPVLTVEHLLIRRGETEILRDVSWQVIRGEHWVILGANGSGKTSLLSALTGYLPPTQGEIVLLGERFGRADWRELRKHVGLVSSSVRQMMADDEPGLSTVVSGKHAVIDLWEEISPADRRRARELLRMVEAEYLEDRPWQVLSQGERQRVLIARALMARPRILILDEPCAGLDPAAREQFLNFIQRLGQRKHSPTLVLVTHHVEEIMPVFSHVLMLKQGQVLVAAKKTEALSTRQLSSAFGVKVKLQKRNQRYAMKVTGKTGVVV